MKPEITFSLNNKQWDMSGNCWVGGKFSIPNLSGGFHGILKQWWDYYSINAKNVLLVSESNSTKEEFKKSYSWNMDTVDYYIDLSNSTSDIVVDLCEDNVLFDKKYDLIINQAMLEHVYNPFNVMKNLSNALNTNGYLISHTCSQKFGYHQWPRDYIRFMVDWWYDLPLHIKDIELIELLDREDIGHVFSLYKKNKLT